ncbi:methyltransferase domain-containing protein [Flavobacteriaceae bacterium MHTCC 0001]
MKENNPSNPTEIYWSQRYQEQSIGWDIGAPSTPLKSYIDQLENKNLNILIPGAGNAYEAEYLFFKDFKNVHILDIAKAPLKAFRKRMPNFPSKHIIHGDFFKHQGRYDLILEQTFFCSFPPKPETRKAYAEKTHELLNFKGKLVGLWFDTPLTGNMEKRPFGGTKKEYLSYFKPYFRIKTFDACYNSIPPRIGSELFGVLEKA